jgi:hypothetical protein
MEHRATISNGRTELAGVDREIRKLIQAIKDGVPAQSIKDELLSLESRKARLQSRLEALGGGEDSKRSPESGDLLVQIKLVAGGG